MVLVADENAFVEEVTSFLASHAARRNPEATSSWGVGDDAIGFVSEESPDEAIGNLRAAQRWRATLCEAGLGWISGPEEFGGRDLPSHFEALYHAVEAGYVVPSTAPLGVGLYMVSPTILVHGNEWSRQRYLRGIRSGEVVACQLFSEPGAGSDLAGLQTRAELDGDSWVVNGQKVWTSRAHYSDMGLVLCRTDPTAPKHKGITAFVLDMDTPGVEVRPLRQLTGGAHFNEVFLTDVRLRDEQRLGEVNGGWGVALTTLMNERAGVSAGGGTGTIRTERVIDLVRAMGRLGDPVVRQQLADIYARDAMARYTHDRGMARLLAGRPPGPEMSLGKLMLTDKLRRICDLIGLVLGPSLVADTGAWGTYAWTEVLLWTPGIRVAGGTDEILRNIIGERVLGLPKEPGPR